MALYRQIAGSQLGYSITLPGLRNFSQTTGETNEYIPSTIDVSDTGATSPFADPRDYNPETISLDTTPLPGPEVSPLPTINPSQPETPTTAVLPADTKTAITNNILPLLALAAVVVVAIKGDDLLQGKRKIALLGGLGLLYYGMAKNKLV
jgi:hypothetical protein